MHFFLQSYQETLISNFLTWLHCSSGAGTELYLVAKCVIVQVVDVGHVNCILEHAPVVAFKLNLPVDGLPGWVLQLFDEGDGWPLIHRQRVGTIEEPDEASLQQVHGRHI